MKYTHIVFDIDGTLTDTETPALVSLADVIRAHKGEDVAPESLKFALGIPGAAAFRIIGFEEKHFPQYMAEWERGLRAFNDQIDVFPGGRELIDALCKAGVQLGIATSKTRDQYEKDFCRFEIAKYFDFSITCEETDDPKPGAGPLKAYMQATGAKPEEMLYIGDSVYDAMCAQAAGVDFALATWGTSDMGIAARYKPDSLMDLLKMIQ